MYEELLAADDNSIPTEYKKIFKAIVENGIKRKVIEEFVADIFVKGNDELTRTLCGFVPCFKQDGGKLREKVNVREEILERKEA